MKRLKEIEVIQTANDLYYVYGRTTIAEIYKSLHRKNKVYGDIVKECNKIKKILIKAGWKIGG